MRHFQIETGGNPGILFKTHPNINKELFSNENILGLKDPTKPFPANQSGDGVGLLKWRMQSMDESVVPLTSEFFSFLILLGLFPPRCFFLFYDHGFILTYSFFLSQLTAGPLFLEMKPMSVSSMNQRQCLIYKML